MELSNTDLREELEMTQSLLDKANKRDQEHLAKIPDVGSQVTFNL
jgi:hypothetical protein